MESIGLFREKAKRQNNLSKQSKPISDLLFEELVNQPDIVVVYVQKKRVIVIDVAIPREKRQEEGTQEARETPKAERRCGG